MNRLSGRYKIEALAPGNPPRVLADWFDNLITNYGLNAMAGTSGNVANYCHVGTGNTPPAFTDVNLAGYKGTSNLRNDAGSGRDVAAGYCWSKKIWTFNQGQAAGNLAEVGIGYGENELFSRALIKDAQGNPTTITVLADEILQVTWEIRLYWPQGAVTGTVDIAGSGTHNYTLQAVGMGIQNVWDVKSEYLYRLSGYAFSLYLYSGGVYKDTIYMDGYNFPYVQNSFKRTVSLPITIDKGNYPGGIDGVELKVGQNYSVASYKIDFDPPIMKTDQDSLTLDFTVSWGRA